MNADPAKDKIATTGLPVVRTWPAVYALVAGAFVVWVILLVLLGRVFS